MILNGIKFPNQIIDAILSNGELGAEVSANYFRRVFLSDGRFISTTALSQRKCGALPAESPHVVRGFISAEEHPLLK